MVYNCPTCLDILIKAGYNMIDTYQIGYDLTNTRFEKEQEGNVVVYTGSSAGSMGIVMYCTIYGGDSWINVASTYSTGDSALYENVETGKFLEIGFPSRPRRLSLWRLLFLRFSIVCKVPQPRR